MNPLCRCIFFNVFFVAMKRPLVLQTRVSDMNHSDLNHCGFSLVNVLKLGIWDDTWITGVWGTEDRGQRHRVHIYSPSLQGRKHLQSLPLPKRNNINSKKKATTTKKKVAPSAAKTWFSFFKHLLAPTHMFFVRGELKEALFLQVFLAFMWKRAREREKSCPSRLFPGEKGLNGSSVLLHSVLGCSASPPGSRMLDSQLLLRLLTRLHVFPPLLLSNLCCRHMRSLCEYLQHCHTFHRSAVSSYVF